MKTNLRLSILVASFMSSYAFGATGGYATATGGGSAAPVRVLTEAALRDYASRTTPQVIQIDRTITVLGKAIAIGSNKTIVGINSAAKIDGELSVFGGKSNVIIKNITMTNERHANTNGDCIQLHGGKNVWVDHSTFYNCYDGLIDITGGADLVTVSWNKFFYTRHGPQGNLAMVIGNNSDSGGFRITLHHNWWGARCEQRMPRLAHGGTHMYNNFLNTPGNSYATNVHKQAQLLSQNNHYLSLDDPIYKDNTSGTGQKIKTSGNKYENCTGRIDRGIDPVFTPSYSYTLAPVTNVKSIVTGGAGAGRSLFTK